VNHLRRSSNCLKPTAVAIDRRYGNLLLEFWRDEGPQTAVSIRIGDGREFPAADRLSHTTW